MFYTLSFLKLNFEILYTLNYMKNLTIEHLVKTYLVKTSETTAENKMRVYMNECYIQAILVKGGKAERAVAMGLLLFYDLFSIFQEIFNNLLKEINKIMTIFLYISRGREIKSI